jgi:hypothetical protein
MSQLTGVVRELLQHAGLLEVYDGRISGRSAFVTAASLATADLMALGALADALRFAEVGNLVRVRTYAHAITPEVPQKSGLPLLRDLAIARILSKPGAAIAVDWSLAGLEFSVVALGFGANELAGVLANKRGLPIAEDAAKKMKGEGMVSVQELQKREISRVLMGARRTAVFVDAIGTEERDPYGNANNDANV